MQVVITAEGLPVSVNGKLIQFYIQVCITIYGLHYSHYHFYDKQVILNIKWKLTKIKWNTRVSNIKHGNYTNYFKMYLCQFS